MVDREESGGDAGRPSDRPLCEAGCGLEIAVRGDADGPSSVARMATMLDALAATSVVNGIPVTVVPA